MAAGTAAADTSGAAVRNRASVESLLCAVLGPPAAVEVVLEDLQRVRLHSAPLDEAPLQGAEDGPRQRARDDGTVEAEVLPYAVSTQRRQFA